MLDEIIFSIGVFCILNGSTILMLLEGGEEMTVKQFASAVADNANVSVFQVSRILKIINIMTGGNFYRLIRQS